MSFRLTDIAPIAVIVAAALAVGYILFVGHVPPSIPMRSYATTPDSNPCPFLSPSLQFNQIFGGKMPINMTCRDLRKLLQSGV